MFSIKHKIILIIDILLVCIGALCMFYKTHNKYITVAYCILTCLSSITINIYELYNPVQQYDIVYLWVNGRDSVFQNNISKYIQDYDKWAFHKSRYYEHDELLYSLRSIDKYIDHQEIHNIIIVIQDECQPPDWMNLNHSKIRIVYHSQFIPQRYLPTFTSTTIELFICHIPNLLEKYILMNDDVFFMDELYISNYYMNDKVRFDMEIPKEFTTPIYYNIHTNSTELYFTNESYQSHSINHKNTTIPKELHIVSQPFNFQNSMNWNIQILKLLFPIHTIYPYKSNYLYRRQHTPSMCLKSVDNQFIQFISQMSYKDTTLIEWMCGQKFRSNDVLHYNLFIRPYYYYFNGKGIFNTSNAQLVSMTNTQTSHMYMNFIPLLKCQYMCINDDMDYMNHQTHKTVSVFHKIMHKQFPNKSIYEK